MHIRQVGDSWRNPDKLIDPCALVSPLLAPAYSAFTS